MAGPRCGGAAAAGVERVPRRRHVREALRGRAQESELVQLAAHLGVVKGVLGLEERRLARIV